MAGLVSQLALKIPCSFLLRQKLQVGHHDYLICMWGSVDPSSSSHICGKLPTKSLSLVLLTLTSRMLTYSFHAQLGLFCLSTVFSPAVHTASAIPKLACIAIFCLLDFFLRPDLTMQPAPLAWDHRCVQESPALAAIFIATLQCLQ